MNFLIENKDYIEVIYFLSGPLLLIGLLITLWQIILFKKDSYIRYQRESLKETLAIFDRKIALVESLKVKLWKAEEDESVPDLDKSYVENFEIVESEDSEAWIDAINNSEMVYNYSIDLLNELDTLAQFIVSGLANAEFAYKNNASYFIQVVNDFEHYIGLHTINEESKDAYQSVIELYQRWYARKKKEKLLLQHKQASEEIKKIIIPPEIKNIGH